MNKGKYILRKGFDKDGSDFHLGIQQSFTIGAAVHPEPEDGDVDRNVEYFIKKINNGATFGITQMTYSPENFNIFLTKLANKGYSIPILPGIRIVQKMSQAEFLMKNFKIKIPKDLLDILQKNDIVKLKDYFISLSLEFKKVGAKGAHFFVMEEQEMVGEIIKELQGA